MEKSYLVRDLVGCDVVATDGQRLGQLVDVLPSGANDIYVVGENETEILIPALKNVVLEIDLSNRLIKVQLPLGLKESQKA